MKRFFLIIGIVCIVFLTGMGNMVDAVEPIPTPTKIDYTLPYPGILPDHPLYFLKLFRDKVLEMVIIEPIRKSEFYMLQGDKRLQTGLLLVEQQKFSLAETTISKAEKYMEKAVVGLTTYKTSGGTIPEYVIEHSENALSKHLEVLQGIGSLVPDAQKNGIASSVALVTKIQQDIKALK